MNQSTIDTAVLTRSATIDLLRGMLTRIDNVTPAGLQYLIGKLLPLIRQQALDPDWHCRPADVEVVIRALDELEHEASRVAPDRDSFGHKAQLLVDVLAA